MIKRFEQMEFNEDWEEEDPELRYGPFDDDQLIYSTDYDGPDFKSRDRVEYTRDGYYVLKGKIGTVVKYSAKQAIVCFDDNIGEGFLSVSISKKYNIPIGHGIIVFTKDLKKIN